MNQIRKIIQTQIDQIIQLSELASEIKHYPTVGELREGYLIEFFKKLVPNTVDITSGFITDAIGVISPQLDFVVTQKSSLPLLDLKEKLSIVPVESAILVAEIKSLLNTKALKQIEIQNASIASMNVSGRMEDESFIVPTVILAYDSNIKYETLKKWMKSNGNIVACCIFKKYTLIKDVNIKKFDNIDSNIKHYSVLAFVSIFYSMLRYLIDKRDFLPNLDTYLVKDEKEIKQVMENK